MQHGRRTPFTAGALLIALAGCGAGGDTRTPIEQMTAAWGEMADAMNEMADAIGGIESQANANTVATRLDEEFLPQAHAAIETFLGVLEAMSEEERATMQATIQEDEDARAAFERLNRSAQRLDERTSQLEPRYVTSAFDESVVAIVQSMEQYERRMAELMSGASATPATGDAAWCREMANKPEAQWTMNESLAFASRCVGR